MEQTLQKIGKCNNKSEKYKKIETKIDPEFKIESDSFYQLPSCRKFNFESNKSFRKFVNKNIISNQHFWQLFSKLKENLSKKSRIFDK